MSARTYTLIVKVLKGVKKTFKRDEVVITKVRCYKEIRPSNVLKVVLPKAV